MWPVFDDDGSDGAGPRSLPLRGPAHTFFEHSGAVSCVAVSVEYDMVVSGSSDGTVVIRTLRTGQYVQTLGGQTLDRSPAAAFSDVLISARTGSIVCCSAALAGGPACTLTAYTLNGRLLAQVNTAVAVRFAKHDGASAISPLSSLPRVWIKVHHGIGC